MYSDPSKVGIDELANGEILRADEPLQFDLFRLLVQVNVNLVFVVQVIVQEHGLDVVVLREGSVELSKSVLLTHEEKTLALEALLGPDLLLRDSLRLLSGVPTRRAFLLGRLLVDSFDVPRQLQFIEDQLPVDLGFDFRDDSAD